jgi:hypothetical protein
MNLFEYSQRVKKLMLIEETESNYDSYIKDFSAGLFDKLGEFLENNDELSKKIQELVGTESIEETVSFLLKPNKTIIMRGMANSKTTKDMELYDFLEIFLKNTESGF